MLDRLQKLNNKQNVMLFGPRGSGKSTLLEKTYKKENTLFLDLLDLETEDRFSRNPNELSELINGLPESTTHIVIDEIQKQPRLLDSVHKLIESKGNNKLFVLSGSSARKLKRGGSNLLAGRAFVYHLFPLTFLEYKENFSFEDIMKFGTLPKLKQLESNEEKEQFLRSYALTYLKEEIWDEHLIRNLPPFRKFLEVAAQASGKEINFSSIARDVRTTDKTVKEYFEILEDTLIGFFIEPFHTSFRKRFNKAPKFYFFDTGVTRALSGYLTIPPTPKTSYFGELFEQVVVTEAYRLIQYFKPDYKLSHFRTKDGMEVDLIIERPAQKPIFIEIKSADHITEDKLQRFAQITKEFGECEAICLCLESRPKKIKHVSVLPWKEGLKSYLTDLS